VVVGESSSQRLPSYFFILNVRSSPKVFDVVGLNAKRTDKKVKLIIMTNGSLPSLVIAKSNPDWPLLAGCCHSGED